MAHLTIENLASMAVQKVNAGDSLDVAVYKVFSESTISRKLGDKKKVFKKVRAKAEEILMGTNKETHEKKPVHTDAVKHEAYHKNRLKDDY